MLGSPDNDVPVMTTDAARKRRVLMPLLVLAALGVIMALLMGQGGPNGITGAGSTLAQPLIERSAVAWRNVLNADDPTRPDQTGGDWVTDGDGVGYEPVGSMGGILRLDAPEIDFAMSDYPLSTAELDQRGLIQVPVVVGAVAMVHSLDLPEGQTLQLDATTVAAIYQGRIPHWNSPALAALNQGIALPNEPITPVHRSEGSGSTQNITAWLAAGSPEWAAGPGTGNQITWPGPGPGVKGSGGMIETVDAKRGSIGYAEPGQAQRAGLQIARLKNAAGSFVAPDATGMQAAIDGANWSADDSFATSIAGSGAPGAYPVTTAVYALVKREPRSRGTAAMTRHYLDYLIGQFGGTASELGYLPLPPQAVEAVKAHLSNASGDAT